MDAGFEPASLSAFTMDSQPHSPAKMVSGLDREAVVEADEKEIETRHFTDVVPMAFGSEDGSPIPGERTRPGAGPALPPFWRSNRQ